MSEVNNGSSKFELANHIRKALKYIKKLKIDEKAYHKAIKKIYELKEDDINAIVKKYSTKPDKQKKELVSIFGSFVEEVKIYLKEQIQIIHALNHLSIELSREEYDQEGFIDKIMHEWYESARIKGSVFTETILHDLKKEFEEFEKKIKEDIKRDVKNDRKISHDHQPKVGFINKFVSDKKLERKLRRLGKKARKEDKRIHAFKSEMEQQLHSTGAQLSFPYLFAKVLHEEGELEALIQKLRLDTQEIVFKSIKINNELATHAKPLLGLFSNYKEFHNDKTLHELIKEHDEMEKYCETFASIDYQDEVSIYRKNENEDSDFHKFMHYLSLLEHHNTHNQT